MSRVEKYNNIFNNKDLCHKSSKLYNGLKKIELPFNFWASVIKKFKPKKAILTNLSPVLDYKVLKKMMPKNVIPAHDGLTINL